MTIDRRLRLAVLIDAENMPHTLAHDILRAAGQLGNPLLRRAYGNFLNCAGWVAALTDHAITPCQVFPKVAGKNSADIALVIDAMDLLASGQVDGFCLVSADRDFTRLAMRLRESDQVVHGFSHRPAPADLVAACDSFTILATTKPAATAPAVTAPAANAPKPPAQGAPILRSDQIRAAMGTHLNSPEGISLGKFGDALRKKGAVWTGKLRRIPDQHPEFELLGKGAGLRLRLRRPLLIAAE